jgi:hypothetical protein
MPFTTYWLSECRDTAAPGGVRLRPSIAASSSIRLLVVWARPPLSSTTSGESVPTSTAAYPPGPGLGQHPPSV